MTETITTTAPTKPDKRLSKADETRRRLLRSIAVGGMVTCAALAGLDPPSPGAGGSPPAATRRSR